MYSALPPTLKNHTLLRTAQETSWRTKRWFYEKKNLCSCDEIFPTKHFNFGWLSLTNFVTLRKPTMVSVFLNLNISYAEITGPALDAMRTCNICKLIRTLFLCTYLACLLDQIYTGDFIVIQALDSCESYESNSTRQKYRF